MLMGEVDQFPQFVFREEKEPEETSIINPAANRLPSFLWESGGSAHFSPPANFSPSTCSPIL
jgi:hypothetical protein